MLFDLGTVQRSSVGSVPEERWRGGGEGGGGGGGGGRASIQPCCHSLLVERSRGCNETAADCSASVSCLAKTSASFDLL